MPYIIGTGYNDETLKQVHNPIYEATTSGPAGFPSEEAEKQADHDVDRRHTYKTTIKKGNGIVKAGEKALALLGHGKINKHINKKKGVFSFTES